MKDKTSHSIPKRYRNFNPLPFRCIECGKSYSRLGELEEHLLYTHDYTHEEIIKHLNKDIKESKKSIKEDRELKKVLGKME